MRNLFILIVLFLFSCCSEKKNATINFEDNILNEVIENSNGISIELPDLYSKLEDKILTDNEEKSILVEKLRAKGFKVINFGRGNHFNGPRIVIFTLKNNDCECEVSKLYYATSVDSLYQIKEKISCKKI
ncbi:MAG: hypothetical protein O9267_14385 [Flavobacterium sp.]|uniref:hypothetical protein n=1 Tax=Flavobacterium sp. TaxID=239 RepID=UPI0022C8D2F5|nr:hypothetical protein [Flavobacterium sp.]MCZ8198786.1 hypothetical protein [Flavobacterium sp.]